MQPFVENVEKTIAFPSRWPIIGNTKPLYISVHGAYNIHTHADSAMQNQIPEGSLALLTMLEPGMGM